MLSPVLLVGGGTDLPAGAALPLLAGYLRRHGVEAYAVMTNAADPALAAFRSPTSVGVASERLQAAGFAPAAVVRALAALASRGLLSRR